MNNNTYKSRLRPLIILFVISLIIMITTSCAGRAIGEDGRTYRDMGKFILIESYKGFDRFGNRMYYEIVFFEDTKAVYIYMPPDGGIAPYIMEDGTVGFWDGEKIVSKNK